MLCRWLEKRGGGGALGLRLMIWAKISIVANCIERVGVGMVWDLNHFLLGWGTLAEPAGMNERMGMTTTPYLPAYEYTAFAANVFTT